MTNRLKEAREAAGLSQAQLAKESGVGQTTICKLENKEGVSPRVDTAVKLAGVLKKDLLELFS